MEHAGSCETDPPEIHRRLESIQRQRALIEDLTTRLKASQLEHDRMETELNEYRASIAPIRKCPEEVLLMIFEFFAVAAPKLVASLLQVCKLWRDIAANAPRLWTHIQIKVKPTWDQRKAARRDKAMIETYLEHSASLPLHINVNLKDMLNVGSQEAAFRSGFLRNGCINDMCGYARRFMTDLDEGQSDTITLWSEHAGPRQVLHTIDTLVGEDGIHMGRWKTLRIFLPRGRVIREIWNLFSGPTPQLTELLISGKGSLQRRLVSSSESRVSLPDLSSLEVLTLNGITEGFNFLGLTFPSVERLDLALDISHYSQLSRFTSLVYLDVLFKGASPADAVKPINLPSLRHLFIHLYGPTVVEWDVPVLWHLRIIGTLNDESKALPNVHAVKVGWELGLQDIPTGIEPELLRTLQTILSEYRDMQELSLRLPLKPFWEKYVHDLSEEERLDLPMISYRG